MRASLRLAGQATPSFRVSEPAVHQNRWILRVAFRQVADLHAHQSSRAHQPMFMLRAEGMASLLGDRRSLNARSHHAPAVSVTAFPHD